MIVPKGQRPVCPVCDEEWEYPVEDYTVAGEVGPDSVSGKELCYSCDTPFIIENMGNNLFDVEQA